MRMWWVPAVAVLLWGFGCRDAVETAPLWVEVDLDGHPYAFVSFDMEHGNISCMRSDEPSNMWTICSQPGEKLKETFAGLIDTSDFRVHLDTKLVERFNLTEIPKPSCKRTGVDSMVCTGNIWDYDHEWELE